MPRKTKTPENVVQLPPDWKQSFRGHSMRSSFCLALTQPMLEFLCATADGVHWDRYLYHSQFGMAKPDCWMASGDALVKRGLIERLTRAQIDANQVGKEFSQTSHYRLTPAGNKLVELMMVTGIFIKADAALNRAATPILQT